MPFLPLRGKPNKKRVNQTIPSGVQIPLTINRLVAGTGTTLVSNGIPLAQGYLMPGATNTVRLFIGSTEQQIYCEALEGRHSDGSVVSLLVQVNTTLTYGTPVTATLALGVARGTSDIAKTAISSIPAFGYPISATLRDDLQLVGFADGVAWPSSAAYLITTGWVEPTITAAAATALGGIYANYEAEFVTYSDRYWDIWGQFADPMPDGFPFTDNIINAVGYYERGVFTTAQLMRSADVTRYYPRACAYGFTLRATYYQDNSYVIGADHFLNPEMMLLHYWLTGDPESLNAVDQLADIRYTARILGTDSFGDKNGPDPRICSKLLSCCIAAHRAGLDDYDWAARALVCVDRIFGEGVDEPLYRTSGPVAGTWAPAWCGEGTVDDPGTPEIEEPKADIVFGFMNCLMMRALRHHYRWVAADSRIVSAVGDCLDFLIANMLEPASPGQSSAFTYLSEPCPGEAWPTTGPSTDLNGFYASNLAWYAQQVGIGGAGASYLAVGETMFESLQKTHDGALGPVLNDVVSNNYQKQYNECYFEGFPFYSFRQG